MRSGDHSSLLLHFVDRYWSEVEGVKYVNTFQNMKGTVEKLQVRCSCAQVLLFACPLRSGVLSVGS